MGNYNTKKANNIEKLQRKILNEYPWIDEIMESYLITDCKLPDCPIIYVNDSFERMTRYPKEEILGKNCRFLQGNLTEKNSVRAIRHAVEHGLPLEVEILNYRKDGVPFMNVLLILPVHASRNRKKVTHFVAIQKDVTTYIPDDSHISEWKSIKLAMIADASGFQFGARVILENNLTGKEFVDLTDDDLIQFGLYSRRERRDILKWVEQKKKEVSFSGTYPLINGTFGAVNDKPNLITPRNLCFWEKSNFAEIETTAVKCYYGNEIKVFTVQRNITLDAFHEKLKLNFGYSLSAKHTASGVEIESSHQLAALLNTKNTVCFNLKLKLKEIQEGYDILSSNCVPMLLVNNGRRLGYLNKAAERLLPNVQGERFSSVFGESYQSLLPALGSSFLCTVSSQPAHVSVSPCSGKVEQFVLTVVLLPVADLENFYAQKMRI